ncbi:MAG: cupin, partial [Rhodospirillales bacterium]|nr:cupin [Rhodospirillales bacterium]
MKLADDGLVPNNPSLAARIYRAALPVRTDAERQIEARFADNGWSNAWVNGIYQYHHYHATAHEVLGVAQGSARVQLGGPSGPIVELQAGDGVLIPAGVGHCC